jgi:hypothetical protein
LEGFGKAFLQFFDRYRGLGTENECLDMTL